MTVKVDVYSLKGVKSQTKLALPGNFGVEVNPPLLAQALRVYVDRSHPGLAKVKTRAEVDRTTKKVYRQKGTGGARHGSKKAPIYVGGGVAHGPKGIKRVLEMPLRMRKKALDSALSLKAKAGEVFVVNGLSKLSSTSQTKALVEKLGGGKLTFALSDGNLEASRYIRNLPGATVFLYKDLNARRVFFGGKLVIDAQVFGKQTK